MPQCYLVWVIAFGTPDSNLKDFSIQKSLIRNF